MSFDEQKQKIQEMINDGQKRVEDITTKYTNYIKHNKQISTELEQLVNKLKECTGNLGKIGEAYQRSKEETKKMEEDFTTKVQASEIQSEQRNQEAEERILKQKTDLEAAAAAQKQQFEAKIEEDRKASEAAMAQQKKEQDEAMNALKKQKAEADILAGKKMEESKAESAQTLEAEKQASAKKLEEEHQLNESQKAAVQQAFEEFKQKSIQELEDLKNEAAAAKETSDNAHKEQIAQLALHEEELLGKKDEAHNGVIEQMKADFEKQRDELKSSLENTQSSALEEAKLECQKERQNLVDQITAFQDSIKQLTANQDEEVKLSLEGFKDTVTETCSKIQAIQDQLPKEEEVPPQLKTEETPVGPQPPPIPTPEEAALIRARSNAGDQAKRDQIWAEAIQKIPSITHLPHMRSGGSGMNPNWLFKDDIFAYEMCANKGMTEPEQCSDAVIKAENKIVIDAFAPFREETEARQKYEQHVKHAFVELALSMKKQNLHYDKDLHEIRIWLRMWFIKYMIAFPIKQKKIPTDEEHKKWYALNLKYEVDPKKYKSLEKALAKLGHAIKHSPGSHHRRRSHSRSRPRSKSPTGHKGGFRYGMKIPRRRTLRSKLKTQRLKSVKKNRKIKGKKSRKKRRRKNTAKNKK